MQVLTGQHFWDQVDSVPVSAVAATEQRMVQAAVAAEGLPLSVMAYDTSNFLTRLEITNQRSQRAQPGHSQRRHDFRHLGLALIASEEGQIPLGRVLYEGSRVDGRGFQALLKPLRGRLRALSSQPNN